MAIKRNPRTYAKATFPVHAAMADEAAGLLVARGALGCAIAEMEKPGRRPREVVTLEAYFAPSAPADLGAIRDRMRQAGMLSTNAHRPNVRTIVDPGWATMWQARFAPLHIGRSFLIVPPWDQKKETGRNSIVIRGGRAFGTGHHASTAGALRAIEMLSRDHRRFATALDVGTGSGVLAFAMASLGATVTAIDIDREALANARENYALNRTCGKIHFSSAPLQRTAGRFDLIAANIFSSVLIEMAPLLVRRLKPQGHLVMSGILGREVHDVIAAFPRLLLKAATRSRGWATIVMAK